MTQWPADLQIQSASLDRVPSGDLGDHSLGRLTTVDFRSVWSSESADFTPWLAANLQLLGDALGIDELELVQREVPVGPFFLDLLAKDAEGRTIAIENQLLPSAAG